MKALFKRYLKDESGVSFIEFAFTLPILVLLFYGVIEVSRNVQMHQKLDNAVANMVGLLNQNLDPDCDAVYDIMEAVPLMISPYDTDGLEVIVTSVTKNDADPNTPPTTDWQEQLGAGGIVSEISDGNPGDPADLPFITLNQYDQVIIGEVFLDYRPILNNSIIRGFLGLRSSESGDIIYTVYKYHVARPRHGTFQNCPCGC